MWKSAQKMRKSLVVLEKKKKKQVEIIVVDPIFIQLLMDIYIYSPKHHN
jgi:hypothetical protein